MICVYDNTTIYTIISIGLIIWFVVVKLALKDNEKRELERKKEEEMLSALTESERKKYEKDKSKSNFIGEIIYTIVSIVSEIILAIF